MYNLIRFLALALLITAANKLSAQNYTFDITNTYKVGPSPMKAIKGKTGENGYPKLHIFCAGIDNNYNDKYDDGDVKSSWWVLEHPDEEARMVMEFDEYLNYRPFRPAIDDESQSLWLPLEGKIIVLDLDGETISNDNFAQIDASAIDYHDNKLLITTVDGLDVTGKIHIYDLTNSTLTESGETAPNPIQSIFYPEIANTRIAVLTQGEFGKGKSNLSIGYLNQSNKFIPTKNFEVGGAVNHVFYHSGKLFVTDNMGYNVIVCDIESGNTEVWYNGTSGWDGPRESLIIGDKLLTSTYQGSVMMHDAFTGMLLDVLNDQGDAYKLEGISEWYESSFVTTAPYDTYYGSTNLIQLWEIQDISLPEFLKQFEVGSAPVGLLFESSSKKLHIFCRGNDINGNGNYDNGEELPSWWTAEINNNQLHVQKRAELSFGDLKYPFKPAYNSDTKILYLPAAGYIKAYDAETYELIDDAVAEFDAVALDMAGTHLMAAVRHEETPDSIVVINLKSGAVLQKVYAGNHVLDLKYFSLTKKETGDSEISLAILTGKENGTQPFIMYGPILHMQDFSLNNVSPVSDGSFALANIGNLLISASNTSDDVTVIDAESNEKIVLKTGTNYGRGPLSIMAFKNPIPQHPDVIMAGTDFGDLRPFIINNSMDAYSFRISNFLPVLLPAESVILNSDPSDVLIAATSAYNNGNINNKVTIVSSLLASIKEFGRGNVGMMSVYPNPASDFINIEAELRDITNPNVKFEIISINGDKVFDISYNADYRISKTINLRDINISSGTYILRIINGSEIKSLVFNVIR